MNKDGSNIPLQHDGTKTPFPSEDVDPKVKETNGYGLIVANAIYYTSTDFGPKLFYNDRSEYDEYVNYAVGENSEDKYKPLLRIDPSQASVTWVGALRWAIKNYATKRVNIAVSKISERQYDPIIDVLDQSAIDERNNVRGRIKFYMEYQDQLKNIQQVTNQSMVPPEISEKLLPQSDDELEVWLQANFKEKEAIAMEKAISHVLERNRFPNIKRATAFDTFVKGTQSLYVGMDPSIFPEIYHCNPEDMIVPGTDYEDFHDIGYAAHIQTPTIPEFYRLASNDFSKSELARMVSEHGKSSRDTLHTHSLSDNKNSDQPRMVIMRFAYKSYNEMVHIEKKDKHGNPRLHRKRYSDYKTPKEQQKFKETYGDERKLHRTGYFSVYEGYWIVGTDIVFGYGEKHHQERKRGNLGQTALPYKFFAPNIKNNRVISTMKQMIPVLDELQEYHVKKQHIIANAIPAVWSIDLKALRDATFTWNNKNMSDQQKIEFLFQTGIFVYDSGDRFKSGSSYQPIRNLANSVAQEVMMYMEQIRNSVIELDEIIGYNKVTSASSLRPDTLKGTAEIQENSSEVALDYLYRADREVSLDVIKSLGVLTRQSIKYRKDGYWEKILSKDQIDTIKNSKFGDYGYRAELRPTQKMWNTLYDQATQAVNSGAIGWDDYMELQSMNNLKEARAMFRVWVRQREERQNNAQMGPVQANVEGQKESNQQMHENRLKELEIQKELKGEEFTKEERLEMIRHRNKLKEIRLEKQLGTAGKVIENTVQGEMDEAKMVAENLLTDLNESNTEQKSK